MPYSPDALLPGTVIGGFELVRMLGIGGFGITYEAISPVTRRKYAVKEFFPRGIASRESETRLVCADSDRDVMRWALERFETTTADLCQLRHPNIMQVVHYIKENETGYMIMEYVEGDTFEDWLRDRGAPPSPRELRPLVEPLLDALEYVHDQGVIHRDIAPDNIMICPDGRPVVIDFGAMKIPERSKKKSQTFFITKQHYAAPEQTEEESPPAPTLDIYSMGAVLYRALADVPPPDATIRKSGLVFRGVDPYVPLASAAPTPLPEAITAIIDSALSLQPAHRPQNVGELRAGLVWDEDWPVRPAFARPQSQDHAPDGLLDDPPVEAYDEVPRRRPESYKAQDDTNDTEDGTLDEQDTTAAELAAVPRAARQPSQPSSAVQQPMPLSAGRWIFLAIAVCALAALLWAAISIPGTPVKLFALAAAAVIIVASWQRRPRQSGR